MGKKVIEILQIFLLTLGFVLVDLSVRYLIEESGIIEVSPRTIPNYGNSHISNILDAWLWVIVTLGWVYLIVVLAYKRILKLPMLKRLVIGASLYIITSFAYITFAKGFQWDLAYQSVLASVVVIIIVDMIMANVIQKPIQMET